MYSLKGFIEVSGLVDNTVGATSAIGELSTFSATFTKEQGVYISASYPNIQLLSFSSLQDSAQIPVPDAYQKSTFAVAGVVYTGINDLSNTSDRAQFLQTLVSLIGTGYQNVDCGEMVQQGQHWAPEWVSWNPANSNDFFKIWFSDTSFQAQYDEYSIIVIPPFTPLDNFFLAGAKVDAALNAVTPTYIVTQMQSAKNGHPETYLQVESYDYHNPDKTADYVGAQFGVVIYGTYGNNDDAIRDAIVDYILANSTHTRDEWTKILPDLFKRTEFVIIPFYDTMAIPNKTLNAGVYSPVVPVKKVFSAVEAVCSDYADTHITTYLEMMSHNYKSLILAVCGGPDNRNNKFYITDYYSDYIAVPTSSPDFSRMSSTTQDFAIQLATLLQKAEDLTAVNQVPAGFTRVVRNKMVFLAMSVNKIQYLALAKYNFGNTLKL